MKRILKIMIITSLIMLVLVGVAAFFLYRGYNKEEKAKETVDKQELDMPVYGIKREDVSKDTVIPLYLSGDKKNVETSAHKNAKEIYNTAASKKVKDSLNLKKKRNRYTIDEALWAYNPFGTHDLSLYLYFEAQQVTTLRYTVHVEDEDIPDFTRTARVSENAGDPKKMECIITGLVPGVENFIVLKLQDENGEIVKRAVYSITPPEPKGSVQKQLTVEDGSSMTEMSNGLYLFMGYDADNKKMEPAIYLYDNSGILRGAIPIVNSRALRSYFLDGNLFYNYSDTSFAEVSPLGQVLKTYSLKNYKMANDYTYDGFGSLFLIATGDKSKTKEDQIISLDLKTGKTKHLVDMGKLLKKQKQKAKDKKSWLGLDSIIWAGKDSVILGTGQLSGIVKVKNISSVKPSVEYVIGSSKIWKGIVGSKKLLEKYTGSEKDTESDTKKTEPFLSQYGQSNVMLSAVNETLSANDTQYYLTMFNNNYDGQRADTSYYYKYLVDEQAGTYDLAASFQIPYSKDESSAAEYAGNIIVNAALPCTVGEYDKEGNLIQQLRYHVDTVTYRVFKTDFKNFWFS